MNILITYSDSKYANARAFCAKMAKKYGKWRLHKSIDKFFFQSEIARILRMSEDEANPYFLPCKQPADVHYA